MQSKFQQNIFQNFPFLKDKKLLLAISGGIDSMVLLHLFRQLNYDFAVAHCNFQLRNEESDADETFVISECQQFQIPFYLKKFDTKSYSELHKFSIQLTARKLRYDWFYELLEKEKYDYILTAHHLDDCVETFFINISRGTGLEGLTGIPAQNDKIIRPLLPFSRAEIEKFANENKILWREDSSNLSDKYLRNKIRHHIVPLFKEMNPSFLHSFQNTLKNLQQAETLVNDASNLMYEKVVVENQNTIEINIPKLLESSNYKAYLYQWFNGFGFSAWNDIYSLVYAQAGKQVFSETHILLKDRDKLLLSKRNFVTDFEIYQVESIESKVNFPLNLTFCKVDYISETNPNCIFVDEEKIIFPLTIRKWQNGDYFYPEGMNGKKKLSKYYKDEKYSIFDKENQWLLCSENQIIWIIGKRADNRFITQKTTQKSIKIELK